MKIDKNTASFVKARLDLISTQETKRYSTLILPSYRHIPGLTPHPISHPDGHSYGKTKPIVTQISETNWKSNAIYLYSVDLFNYKYYWECHEYLEDLWKIEQVYNLKIFIQGIIQVSAALLKHFMGMNEGMKKLQIKGLSKLKEVMNSSPTLIGIDIGAFIYQNEQFFNSKDKESLIPPIITLKL